jgi:flagellar protein FlaG
MIKPSSPIDHRQPAATPAGIGAGKEVAGTGSQPAVPVENAESVREAVAALNRAAKALNNSVQLSLDSGSGRAVVRVIDSETGQLIRQIPSEEALELRRALDRIAGLLIHRTA